MTVRLATVAPDLAEALAREPSTRRRAVAQATSEWVVREVGLIDPRVDAALAALRDGRTGQCQERHALKVLADELDEHAWDVQDRADSGDASQDEYLVAFARARAASAVWFALDSDALQAALEALYESQAATGNVADMRRRFCEQLE